jgi:hypothetical protein
MARQGQPAQPVAAAAQHGRFHPVPTQSVFTARPVSYEESPAPLEPDASPMAPPALPAPTKSPAMRPEGEEVPVPPRSNASARRVPTRARSAPPAQVGNEPTQRIRVLVEEEDQAPVRVSASSGLNWRPYR